jgi:hypothetical protein
VKEILSLLLLLSLVAGCKRSPDPIVVLQRAGDRLSRLVDESADCEQTLAALQRFKEELAMEMERMHDRAREMRRSMTPQQRRAYRERFNEAYGAFTRQVRGAMTRFAKRCKVRLEFGPPAKAPL